MSDSDLETISRLRVALANPADAWPLVTKLESSLETDPRYSREEQELMRRLRSQVSDLIAAERDGLNHHPASASVTLTGLEGSIRRRTTGVDGWKLG